MAQLTIIGGGIVGLATGYALTRRFPQARVRIIEKENAWAFHQTGRNSGVIHSGIYYKPGSFKAEFSRKGRQSLEAFCKEQGIPFELCGKLIVATEEREIPLLENLYQRGLQNGLKVEKLSAAQARAREPHVACLEAVWVPETGIVDYTVVAQRFAELVRQAGGELLLGTKVQAITKTQGGGYRLSTSKGDLETDLLINCAGLQSDRVARMAGAQPTAKIVPFRGEYYELVAAKRDLVKGLIYPVPNPDFPFLGVHFTRMIDGEVHAGPNAVLALAREGYGWMTVNPVDLAETLMYSGFRKLAARNLREGLKEIVRSLNRRAFVKSLQKLIPDVRDEDVQPSGAGVRAQALLPDGKLVDDFLIVEAERAVHVLNAPSPAATCSLEIGAWIAERVKLPGV